MKRTKTPQPPPQVPKITPTVRLPEDVKRRAKAHAADLGMKLESYVEKALRLFHESQPSA